MTTKTPTKSHIFTARVYYADTDAGGIVYHANYLVFAERARTELLRDLGFNHNMILKQHSVLLVIRHIEIDYFAPAKLDDLLEIYTEVLSCGRTSVNMKQVFHRDGKKLTEIRITVVAVTPEGKGTALPSDIRAVFANCVPGAA